MADFDLVIRGGTVIDGLGSASFAADVAVKDGLIVEVGRVIGKGTEEIDATGMCVTPGFVDVHTHYDGQITWENRLLPSSNHGVTTVVMGNCGVGFAPARQSDHQLVIKLMEGVEDIPEVVMADGVPWNWETFPDYLDALDQRKSDVDFATQLPHSPLRVYVMGERGANLEAATEEDLIRMRGLATEAIRAGALGISTSRNLFHRFRSGAFAPSVKTEEEELLALAGGLKDAGAGVFQLNPNIDTEAAGELDMFRTIASASGRPLNYSLIAVPSFPQNWNAYVEGTDALRAEGLEVRGQFMARPIGVMFGLDLSYHPFALNPSYRPLASLPLAEKVAKMRDPELRAKIISEDPEDPNPAFVGLIKRKASLYPMTDPADYNFRPDDSIQARAAHAGKDERAAIYDALLEAHGHAILCAYTAHVGEYLDKTAPLIGKDNMVPSLGDGGAHYGMICDAAYTTYILAQRVGQHGIDLSTAIKSLTSQPAISLGLNDRGVVAPGYKADLNVIDLKRIALHCPTVKADLPAGGKRLSQRSDGYVATIVSGSVTYRNGEATGTLPGRLVRGAKTGPVQQRENAIAA
ncbi:MAG: amidohydrolase family protein [Sphingomicrobium sp.]